MSIAMAPASSELRNLLERIEQAIQIKTGGRILDLQVTLDEGRLIVTGRTNSYYNKQLATHAVRGTAWELPVQNQVEVG